MKGHGGFNSLDWPGGVQYFCVAVAGAGAAPPVAPTPGTSYVQPDFKKSGNALSQVAAEIPTRSGVGAYIVTYDPSFTVNAIMDCPCNVYGTVGAWAQISAVNAALRQLTVKVFAAAGAAADLAVGDLLVIDVKARDSNAS